MYKRYINSIIIIIIIIIISIIKMIIDQTTLWVSVFCSTVSMA